MKYNSLNHADFKISEIGLGTMSFSSDEKSNQQILDLAMAKGINFLDTADLYQKGRVEEMLGKLTSGIRNKLIFATKVGNVWNADGDSWHWDPSPKHIRMGCEESLKRLKTDRIDLYQLHGGTIEDPWDDIIETFQNLKNEGKIRAFGVSSIRPNVVRKISRYSGVSTIMSQFSILDRRSEENIHPEMEKGQMKLLARGVFARGLLLDKAAKNYLNHSKVAVETIKKYLSTLNSPNEAIAMRFVMDNPVVASAVIGISSPEQMKSTLSAYEVVPDIPGLTIKEVTEKAGLNFYDSHR